MTIFLIKNTITDQKLGSKMWKHANFACFTALSGTLGPKKDR